MLRSLPFHAESLLLGEVAIPWGVTVAIAWLAIILGGAQLDASRLSLFLLIPPVCLILSLISAYDVLRQSNAGMLLNGNVPGISWRALLGGILCLAILAGIIWLLRPFRWIGMLLAFAVSLMLAYGAWHMAARKYRSIS
jgi:predicted CDP-diglyceride synthetase/phosphatidate cytidylyltransferase